MKFYADGKQNLLRHNGKYYERYISASVEEKHDGYWWLAPSGDFLITWGTRYGEIGSSETERIAAGMDQ